MRNRLDGKIAFITGAARGQGRAHAVRMAEEGADVIAVDICDQIKSVKYPLASPDDLDQTASAVKDLGRRIVALKADVRERDQLRAAVEAGMSEFGHLDIVVANAGILPMGPDDTEPSGFVDASDVDLLGTMNTVAVSLPHLADGSSIIVTGSTAAMMPNSTASRSMGSGGAGYIWAKRTLIGYVEQMSYHLAPRFIRVNAIHPTNVNTHMVHNDEMYKVFRPDLEHPTPADAEPAFTYFHAIPIPNIEPQDVANLAVFLACDESRYITGQQIGIDAGSLLKFPEGPPG